MIREHPSARRSGQVVVGQAVKRLSLALSALLAAAALFYVWAGYYGSRVFAGFPADGAAIDRPALVMLSGDMGDRIGMMPGLADRLNARGYAIVSVNSLTYFSVRRSAKDVAGLIKSAIIRAEALGRTREVVLIGQSLGADMLHAGLAELPVADRAAIRAVVLIVPGRDIVFRASPVELVGLERPDRAALPSASALTWVPVTCIFGKAEIGSLCPELSLRNAKIVSLPGGHRLDSDGAALERAVLAAIRQSGSQHASVESSR